MNLEYIKEEDNNWYNDDEFYINETEPEDIKYIENFLYNIHIIKLDVIIF